MTRSFPLSILVALPLLVGWFLVLWPGRVKRGAAAVAAFVAQFGSVGLGVWVFWEKLLPLLRLWHEMPATSRGPVPARPMLLSNMGTWFTLGDVQVHAAFRLDGLSALAVLLTGLSGIVALFVAWAGSVRVWKDRDWARHVGAALVAVGSVQALVMSADFLWAAFWWVLVTQSALLVVMTSPGGDAPQRARKAWWASLVVDGLFIAAMLVFVFFARSGDLTHIDFGGRIMVRPRVRWVFGLKPGFVATLLLGAAALARAGQFPLHRWFIGSARSSSVSLALFLGALAPSGLFFFLSLSRVIALSPVALAVIGAAGLFSSLLLALSSTSHHHMGKSVAYLATASLGLAFGSVGLGGFTEGVFHASLVAVVGLTLASATGAVSLATDGVMDLRDLGGLAKPMPLVALGMLVGVLALVGLYPLGGWYSLNGVEQVALTHLFPRTPGLMRLKPGPAVVWNWLSYGTALLAGAVIAYSAMRLWMSVFAGKKTLDKLNGVAVSLRIVPVLTAFIGAIAGLVWIPKNRLTWLLDPSLWGQRFWIVRDGWRALGAHGVWQVAPKRLWLLQGIWALVVLGAIGVAAGLFAGGTSRLAARVTSSRWFRWFYRWLNGDLGFGILGRFFRWIVGAVAWLERGLGERLLADWIMTRVPAGLVGIVGWFAGGMDKWGRRGVVAAASLGLAVTVWLLARSPQTTRGRPRGADAVMVETHRVGQKTLPVAGVSAKIRKSQATREVGETAPHLPQASGPGKDAP